MIGWMTYATKPEGHTLANRLTLARLKEVWVAYSGQTIWPDGITLRAVAVTVHLDAVQAAVFVGPESWHLLTTTEKTASKTKDDLDKDGWFGAVTP